MHRDQVTQHIETLLGTEHILRAQLIDTHMANGVQILGNEEVTKIAVGVSANVEFLEAAVQAGAQYVMCKHPLSFQMANQLPDRSLQQRLRLVFQHNLTLAGYHWVLDTHPQFGNTPLLLEKLGTKDNQSAFGEWGYIADLVEPMTSDQLVQKVETIVHRKPLVIASNPAKKLNRIGMVSGGGTPSAEDILEMTREHVDVYLTGEIHEWHVTQFAELGITYIAAGHHATEVLGPQTFAQALQQALSPLLVEFLNIWNEV